MHWTTEYFLHRSKVWESLRENIDAVHQPGHSAFAAKQMSMWLGFANEARDVFKALL
jgi:hypothetical protein